MLAFTLRHPVRRRGAESVYRVGVRSRLSRAQAVTHGTGRCFARGPMGTRKASIRTLIYPK